ncbi:MAG: SGNH/GDSL hydrolase family protein [Planctomycetes bacterium]|nr:SGNH/GDSL hydrolase family protein [Planctomycetota bacterium]
MFASVGAGVGAALLLELALRLVGYPSPQPRTYAGEHESRPSENFIADPELGWRMKPLTRFSYPTEGREHEYVADARGFRRAEQETATSSKRLAVLGDSFAWGAGVDFDETFAARTARELGTWRLSNWGMPGYGVDQIATTLRTRALAEKPDLVLVAIYAWDFQRSLSAYRDVEGMTKPVFEVADGELVPRTSDDTPSNALRWLDEHSYAFTAAKLASWRVAMQLPHGEWWSLNRAFVERMIDDCAAAGVKVAFVHVPTISWNAFPALGELCAARGVPWFDPAAEFPARPDGIYYASDKHLNAAGHAWLAERIVAWLSATKLGD